MAASSAVSLDLDKTDFSVYIVYKINDWDGKERRRKMESDWKELRTKTKENKVAEESSVKIAEDSER